MNMFASFSLVSGSTHLSLSKFNHIAELDLTDNLLSEWSEIFVLLRVFPSLEFLNLSNNLLHTPITQEDLEHHVQQKQQSQRTTLMTKKLVLNGNKINWTSADRLIQIMPQLEELHLSTNNLHNPTGEESIQHENLRLLYLSCNPIDDFQDIAERLTAQCPMLEQLSLSECPVTFNAEPLSPSNPILPNLSALNLSTTKISTWEEVDKLRGLSALTELRIQHVPLLGDCTVHERRSLLIARLPNIQILNGGDIISKTEREDAERGFIRFHLESDPKPQRYHELVAVHGELDPLVNIDLTPDTVVRVKVCHKDLSREEDIHLYQTVQQFKGQLQDWFGVAPQNMKLYYCDKVSTSFLYVSRNLCIFSHGLNAHLSAYILTKSILCTLKLYPVINLLNNGSTTWHTSVATQALFHVVSPFCLQLTTSTSLSSLLGVVD